MKNMTRIAGIAMLAGGLAGCAFNPEGMPVGQRDSEVYVDPGAPKTLTTHEERAKVSVIASVGEYKAYTQVAEMLDSSLNSKLAEFAFFQVVTARVRLHS